MPPQQRARHPGALMSGARELTGTSLERTRAVVDEVLAKASRDGERAVCFARLILGGIICVLWPLATLDEMLSGVASDYAVVGLSLAAVLFSAYLLLRLRRGPIPAWMRTLSIIIDAVFVLGILASFVARPPPTYLGLGRISGIGAAYFAILAAGIRLSTRGALVAVAVFVVGIGTLMGVDQMVNGYVDTVANWVTIGALVVTAGVFAVLIATRTQKLVLEGANQTLLAERTRARFGAYVSEEVATAALAADDMRLGGVRQEVAVLFSDLRAFTTSSERMDPEDLVRELNEYFELMVAAVSAEGGVVDKYIGDSIMAVFGAPTPRADDAARAIRAAWRMEQALVRLNEMRGKRGLLPLRHGIGVHTGTVVAGNIGTTSRAQYTVIGDTVNVAARLESATKDQGVSVLLSAAAVTKMGASSSTAGLTPIALGPSGIVRSGGTGGALVPAIELPPLVSLGEVTAKGREERVGVFTFGALPAPLS